LIATTGTEIFSANALVASLADFTIAKAKDEDKIEWCKLNNIDIVVLKYSNTDEEWRQQIENS
jgi:hypothetical protein